MKFDKLQLSQYIEGTLRIENGVIYFDDKSSGASLLRIEGYKTLYNQRPLTPMNTIDIFIPDKNEDDLLTV